MFSVVDEILISNCTSSQRGYLKIVGDMLVLSRNQNGMVISKVCIPGDVDLSADEDICLLEPNEALVTEKEDNSQVFEYIAECLQEDNPEMKFISIASDILVGTVLDDEMPLEEIVEKYKEFFTKIDCIELENAFLRLVLFYENRHQMKEKGR